MKKHRQIIIIGGGTAGIIVAARMKRLKQSYDILIIDPAENHYYQPAWTLVGSGTYNYQRTQRPMASIIPRGVTWLQDQVTHLAPDENQIETAENGILHYDYLVVCPGIQINIDDLPGLREGMQKGNVGSVYVDAQKVWQGLQAFNGGTALFTQAPTASKCGGAPQKMAYMGDDYFRRKGIRQKTNVVYATPGTVIFGVEPFKTTLEKVVDRKQIHVRFFHNLIRIDAEAGIAYYRIRDHWNEPKRLYRHQVPLNEVFSGPQEVAIPFDFMHTSPPQSAPDFIRSSKLVHQEGKFKGWVDVDHFTLQHRQYSNIFALGDVAGLPTGKTGAAVRKQAPVVVQNINRLIQGNTVTPDYHGYSSCPIVTGYGKMVLAEFKYNHERDSDPLLTKFFDTGKELYPMWLLKKYGLPFIYWNLMLKGLM